MKLGFLFAVAIVAALPVRAQSAQDDPPLMGQWARGDGVAKVRIASCDSDVCAINTWIKPGVTDEKVGDRLEMNIKPSGPAQWEGRAHDPQRSLDYAISLDVAGNTMTSRGCVLGVVCKSVGWTRIAD